jgi:hypothetical protein
MPFSVVEIIRNPVELTCVQIDTPIIDALDLMIANNFSQLPVIDKNKYLLGMVTYESIMRATRSFNVKLDSLFVHDAIVKAPTHYQEDGLFDLLDDLKNMNAVIILDPDEHPIGIVTSYDTTEFLRNRTEDSMRLEEIEQTIKDLIRLAYKKENGEGNEYELNNDIDGLYSQRDIPDNKKHAFEELTLNDYIILLTNKTTWPFLEPLLKKKREELIELLHKIRKTRNNLAHFRGDISLRDRDDLRYCANWLTRRYQDYVDKAEIETPTDNEMEEPIAYLPQKTVSVEKTILKSFFELPHDKKPLKINSRYSLLASWLIKQTDNRIQISFEQVEGIIGSPLPDSARTFRAWWANDSTGHTQSRLWLDAGWRVDTVNFSDEWVRFVRVR